MDTGPAGLLHDAWLGGLGIGSLSEPLRGQPIGFADGAANTPDLAAATGREGSQERHTSLHAWPEPPQQHHLRAMSASPPPHGNMLTLLHGKHNPWAYHHAKLPDRGVIAVFLHLWASPAQNILLQHICC